MSFVYNAFTEEDIINAVNHELAGTRTQVTALTDINCNVAQLKTKRNATIVAVLGSFQSSRFFVRAVHRIKNKRVVFGYLPNGQASKNLDTLAFSGEHGTVTQADKNQYTDYLRKSLPHCDDKQIAERVKFAFKHASDALE